MSGNVAASSLLKPATIQSAFIASANEAAMFIKSAFLFGTHTELADRFDARAGIAIFLLTSAVLVMRASHGSAITLWGIFHIRQIALAALISGKAARWP